MREPLCRVRDNPILIAQARRRLRRRHLVPALLITGLLCVSGALLTAALKDKGPEKAWGIFAHGLLCLIGALLYLRGTLHVAGMLGEERRSGILDFHRATPTTPWTDAIGYLLGCPAREYALCVLVLPFLVLSTVLSEIPLLNMAVAVALMVLTGWLYHAVAMSVGLSMNSKRGTSGVAVAVVLILLLFGRTLAREGLVTLAYLTPYPAVAHLITGEIDPGVGFYGLTLPPAVFTVLVQGSLLGFLLWAAARKLRREGATAFSRPGAAAFYGLLIFLSFGGSWRWISGEAAQGLDPSSPAGVAAQVLVRPGTIVAGYLIAATAVAAALSLALSPSYLEFVRALRRARRAGRLDAPWLEDGATGFVLVPMLTALLLGGLLVLGLSMWTRLPPAVLGHETLLCLSAQAAFLLFCAGATEYTRLARRKATKSTGVLIFFLTLVLPFIVATIAEVGGAKGATVYVSALSPGYVAVASAVALASAWEGKGSDPITPEALVLSLGVTAALAGWFVWRAHAVKQALKADIGVDQLAGKAVQPASQSRSGPTPPT